MPLARLLFIAHEMNRTEIFFCKTSSTLMLSDQFATKPRKQVKPADEEN